MKISFSFFNEDAYRELLLVSVVLLLLLSVELLVVGWLLLELASRLLLQTLQIMQPSTNLSSQ